MDDLAQGFEECADALERAAEQGGLSCADLTLVLARVLRITGELHASQADMTQALVEVGEQVVRLTAAKKGDG